MAKTPPRPGSAKWREIQRRTINVVDTEQTVQKDELEAAFNRAPLSSDSLSLLTVRDGYIVRAGDVLRRPIDLISHLEDVLETGSITVRSDSVKPKQNTEG